MGVFADRSLHRPAVAGLMRPHQRWLRGLLLSRLARLGSGRIELIDADGRWVAGPESDDVPTSRVLIHDPRTYTALALRGSVGAGESYTLGRWSCDDLTRLVRTLVADDGVGESLEGGWVQLQSLADRLTSPMRGNTRRRSRLDIAAHYDLGNDFFEAFLDETMMYSSAVFPTSTSSLAEASRHKLELICRKLGLGASDHLLEIGTGWGGLAIHAAGRYGCRVTTTTISRAQYEYAARRVREAGLDGRVEVLRLDYRDLPALGRRFDKLVSIEMIEAVGSRHLDTYFRTCSELLARDGAMLLQAIVIADRLYDRYRRRRDFIQRYIFPGGALPSLAAIARSMARTGDLQTVDLHDITSHYAETLRRWRTNLTRSAPAVLEAGYPETLLRMWDYYLSYCEGGFVERRTGVVQMLLARPDWRPGPQHPGDTR